MKSPLRWAGGKTKIYELYGKYFPNSMDLLVDPFVGGGATLYYFNPPRAIIGDANEDLINFYRFLKEKPVALLTIVNRLTEKTEKEDYLKCRTIFNSRTKEPIVQAALFYYLNLLGFHGICRYNRSNEFNVPYQTRRIASIDKKNFIECSTVLQRTKIECGDFFKVIKSAPLTKNSFVVLDPPYDPLTETSNFTGYTKDGFSKDDQVRVREAMSYCIDAGAKVMAFNNNTQYIRKLYSGLFITRLPVKRQVVVRVGQSPTELAELAITNFREP